MATAIMRGAARVAGVVLVVGIVAGGAGGCAARRARFEERVQATTRVVERLVAVEGAWIGSDGVLRIEARRAARRHERAFDGAGSMIRELTPRDGEATLLSFALPAWAEPDLMFVYERDGVVEAATGWERQRPVAAPSLPAWRVEGGLDAVARAVWGSAPPGDASLFVVGGLHARGGATLTPLTPAARHHQEGLIARRGRVVRPGDEGGEAGTTTGRMSSLEEPAGGQATADPDAGRSFVLPPFALPPIQLLPPGEPTAIRLLLVRWPRPGDAAAAGDAALRPRADLLLVDPPAESTFATFWRRAVGALFFFAPVGGEPVALFFSDGTLFFEVTGHLL